MELRAKDLEFWTKVRARRDAYDEAIRIRKKRQKIAAILMPPPARRVAPAPEPLPPVRPAGPRFGEFWTSEVLFEHPRTRGGQKHYLGVGGQRDHSGYYLSHPNFGSIDLPSSPHKFTAVGLRFGHPVPVVVAPNAWAAESPALGPYAYRPAFKVAGRRPVSRAETEEARQLFLRRTAIHRADRPASPDHFARGLRAMEMQDTHTKAGHNRDGVWSMGANPLSREDWGLGGTRFSTEELLPGVPFTVDEVAVLSAHLRGKSGRGRGRPPINGRAMTSTERSRRHRAKEPAE